MEQANQAYERIESLKAGTVAALSLMLCYGIIALASHWLLPDSVRLLPNAVTPNTIGWLVRLASAGLSGFLFGVTYRYVVRDDNNLQLKVGAVLAFGLVRELAQIEIGLNLTSRFWVLGILGVESLLSFSVACFILDWTLHHQWVKPFKSA